MVPFHDDAPCRPGIHFCFCSLAHAHTPLVQSRQGKEEMRKRKRKFLLIKRQGTSREKKEREGMGQNPLQGLGCKKRVRFLERPGSGRRQHAGPCPMLPVLDLFFSQCLMNLSGFLDKDLEEFSSLFFPLPCQGS